MIDFHFVYSMMLLPAFPRVMWILCNETLVKQISNTNSWVTYLSPEGLEYFVRRAFRFAEEVLCEEDVVLPTIPHLLLRRGRKGLVARLVVQLVLMPPIKLHPGRARMVRSL